MKRKFRHKFCMNIIPACSHISARCDFTRTLFTHFINSGEILAQSRTFSTSFRPYLRWETFRHHEIFHNLILIIVIKFTWVDHVKFEFQRLHFAFWKLPGSSRDENETKILRIFLTGGGLMPLKIVFFSCQNWEAKISKAGVGERIF